MLHAVHGDDAFLFWGERVDPSSIPPPVKTASIIEDDAEAIAESNDHEVEEPGASNGGTAVATTTAPPPPTTVLQHSFAATVEELESELAAVLERACFLHDEEDADEPKTPSVERRQTELRLVLPHRLDFPDLPAPSAALGNRLGFEALEPEDLRPRTVAIPAIRVPADQAIDLLATFGTRSAPILYVLKGFGTP